MSPSSTRPRNIGAVLAELQSDFPDVTVSKIRFLEAEGLISPDRTASGYRQYQPADVERLRYILTAQRDRFWPLKVIREALDALDRGLQPAGDDSVAERMAPPVVQPDPEVPTATVLRREAPTRLTGPELAQAAGTDSGLVDELVSFGLLRPDATGHFSGESARIAAAAQALGQFGIGPRHLRPFRTAAEREVGLIDYASDSAAKPDPAAVAAACLGLHTALVKDELGRTR